MSGFERRFRASKDFSVRAPKDFFGLNLSAAGTILSYADDMVVEMSLGFDFTRVQLGDPLNNPQFLGSRTALVTIPVEGLRWLQRVLLFGTRPTNLEFRLDAIVNDWTPGRGDTWAVSSLDWVFPQELNPSGWSAGAFDILAMQARSPQIPGLGINVSPATGTNPWTLALTGEVPATFLNANQDIPVYGFVLWHNDRSAGTSVDNYRDGRGFDQLIAQFDFTSPIFLPQTNTPPTNLSAINIKTTSWTITTGAKAQGLVTEAQLNFLDGMVINPGFPSGGSGARINTNLITGLVKDEGFSAYLLSDTFALHPGWDDSDFPSISLLNGPLTIAPDNTKITRNFFRLLSAGLTPPPGGFTARGLSFKETTEDILISVADDSLARKATLEVGTSLLLNYDLNFSQGVC